MVSNFKNSPIGKRVWNNIEAMFLEREVLELHEGSDLWILIAVL